MSLKVIYDYYEGQQVPIWFVSKLRNIDWKKDYYYIKLDLPFQFFERDEFNEDMMSTSIEMADLTRHPDIDHLFGVYLPGVKERAELHGVDVQDIRQFIIQVSDIEDILQMSVLRNHI